ncbi:hypothetical protein [Psychromonas sp. MB-3u-54]|uniref:hypothetical protein n=1 Tax=Psychromonas sp. MB-3u-54 TaxID=2058319 RepID=UPI0018E3D59C|nr:hypothetical protein [Psychromonas sp. MB-3u-54]
MKKLLFFFTAGCLGALVNSIAVWQFGQLGFTSALGVSIAPSLSPAWRYLRISFHSTHAALKATS